MFRAFIVILIACAAYVHGQKPEPIKTTAAAVVAAAKPANECGEWK